MDVCHTGAAGTYDFVQKLATTLKGTNVDLPPADTGTYLYQKNPDDTHRYRRNPVKSMANQLLVRLEKEKRKHKTALSDDFSRAGLENPACCPVGVAGKIAAMTGTAAILKYSGLTRLFPSVAAGAWDGFAGEYNNNRVGVTDIPEKDMMKNPLYVRSGESGWNDIDTRFEVPLAMRWKKVVSACSFQQRLRWLHGI